MTLLSSCTGKQGATSLDSAFSLLVTITVIAVLASLTAVVWGYWKWKQMTDLIKDLSRTAEAIAGGDLTRRTDVPQHGSHRQLAENFNKMADAYQKVIKGQEVEIVDQTKALARSNEEFQQLSYVVSHDLQEPLRAINGYLQLLKQRHKNAIPTEAKEYIDRSIAATTRMRGQIEALLSYTQLESKGRPFEEVNVAELISQVLSNLESQVKNSGAEINVGQMPVVWGDQNQLSQVFHYLINNAIKFQGTNPAQVFVDADQDISSGFFTFTVQDNGIGIDEIYQERIFVIFQRLHTLDEYPGMGTGLAMCKKIIERHGGKIWFESKVGSGTTFKFTIPKYRGKST